MTDLLTSYLLNHIYQYFGTLLGCTLQGGNSFPSYSGNTNMFAVHKYDLTSSFITQKWTNLLPPDSWT